MYRPALIRKWYTLREALRARHLHINAIIFTLLFLFSFLIYSPLITTSAIELTVTPDKTTYVIGETLDASGKTQPRSIVCIKVFDPDGIGHGMAQTTAAIDGAWSVSQVYKFSANDKPGIWTVRAYMGSLTAEATFLLIEATTPISLPKVLVAYSAYTIDSIGLHNVEEGETFLVVNVTVENQGYPEFTLHPSKVLITNQNVRYNSTYMGIENELQTALLKDEDRISGLLVFVVPQSLVDYRLTYEVSEVKEVNIQYIDNTEYPLRERGKIIIKHSGYTTNVIGSSIPEKGNTFLIVSINTTNQDYYKVQIWPSDFKILINGKEYERHPSTLHLKNILEHTELYSGKHITGSMAFEVPEDIENYDLKYLTIHQYNVEYINYTATPIKTINSIAITYTNSRASSILTYKPDSGNIYIISNITVKNKGYQKFTVNPFYFKIEAQNTMYNIEHLPRAIDNELESTDINNGGKTSGLLVFQIPTTVSNYRLTYQPSEGYNIEYIERLPPTSTYTHTSTPTQTVTQTVTQTPTATSTSTPNFIPELFLTIPIEAFYIIIAVIIAVASILAHRKLYLR